MPANDALEQRMRTVEESAAQAAIAPASTEPAFAEAHRSVEEMIERLSEKCEETGAQFDAKVRSDDTNFYSEVRMSLAPAGVRFDSRTESHELKQRRRRAQARGAWYAADLSASVKRYDATRERSDQQFAELFARIRQPALPELMEPVLKLDRNDQSDAALDELFDRIDPILSSAEYATVDGILAAMPVEGPSLTLMMGLLSITRPAAPHLPSRQRFFERVYRLCKAMRRDAELLLGGLK